MCLGKKDDLGTRDGDDDEPLEDAQPSIVEYALPAQGNILVTFSGTLGYRVHGDTVILMREGTGRGFSIRTSEKTWIYS